MLLVKFRCHLVKVRNVSSSLGQRQQPQQQEAERVVKLGKKGGERDTEVMHTDSCICFLNYGI